MVISKSSVALRRKCCGLRNTRPGYLLGHTYFSTMIRPRHRHRSLAPLTAVTLGTECCPSPLLLLLILLAAIANLVSAMDFQAGNHVRAAAKAADLLSQRRGQAPAGPSAEERRRLNEMKRKKEMRERLGLESDGEASDEEPPATADGDWEEDGEASTLMSGLSDEGIGNESFSDSDSNRRTEGSGKRKRRRRRRRRRREREFHAEADEEDACILDAIGLGNLQDFQ